MKPSRTSGYPSFAFALRLGAFLGRHRFLAALLAADAATKMAAFEFLPHDRAVSVLPGVQLYLAVNDWGVMGGVQGIGAVTANPSYTLALAVGLLVFAFAIHRLGASGLGLGRRLAVGTAVFFAVACAAQGAAPLLPPFSLPAEAVVASIRGAALVVSVAFYAASQAPFPRAAFTLLAAGALANSASHAYPPFEVVDFLMVPAGPVLALFGRGREAGAESVVGVINLADIYVFLSPLVLLAWPLAALVRRGAALTGAGTAHGESSRQLRRQAARD
ncbi:MAG: hypothetical protein LC687_04540 [Actinobacteria bacterium]|nr:hypothetical protein [Actinomycetota bacterium]